MLCAISDDLINWWKESIDFVKIKFHLNENIEWHCMHFDSTWIEIHSIQFRSNWRIGFKFNSRIELYSNTLIGIWTKLNWIELNWIPVQLNSIQTIELRFNWKKNWNANSWKNCLKYVMHMMLGKNFKNLKHKSEKTPFHASLLENGLNVFQTWIW
jgi:hypothetical protein